MPTPAEKPFELYYCDAGYEQCENFSREIYNLRTALKRIVDLENREEQFHLRDAAKIAADALAK